MEEVINKPESQFKDILNDLIDYDKNSEEKSALIEEVCRKATKQQTKPAASLNSSIYSSAASSSSSTSSASDSSTNSASSSSTSSTLSSPSQSNQPNGETKDYGISELAEDYDNIEVPKMEDLGKTARIFEHISSEHSKTANDIGHFTVASHSDRRLTSLYNNSQRLSSSSLVSQTPAYKLTQLHQQANLIQLNVDNANNIVTNNPESLADGSSNSWKTISGKRDKRRRKPAEQPVLSQHIPGHKGEQEVDWLVKFIESGPGAANNANNTTKKGNNSKGSKPQMKRQPAQTIDIERENQQRKPTSGNSNKSASTQAKPLLPPPKSTTNNTTASVIMPQTEPLNQRKVQTVSNNIQSQTKQQPSQDRTNERISERKESSHQPLASHAKRGLEQKREKLRSDEAAVTFADHIKLNDDDVTDRYIFGFFEEQRQQTNYQVKSGKSTIKHNEKSIGNTKTSQTGQKHKLKHPKASLNSSEQKLYKCTDNIDANSFNYHQILEFISNSWESTAKSHRLTVKQTSA